MTEAEAQDLIARVQKANDTIERAIKRIDELTAENLTLRLALEQYEEPVEDDEPEDCSWCRGCGEGDYDGAACRKCHGTGVEPVEKESDV